MNNVIKVFDVENNAMTEAGGIKLRDIINQFIEKNETVVVDFSSISLFATPFFNACFGYFFCKLKEDYDHFISVTNLSSLGISTYNHSIENAKNHAKNITEQQIGQIAKATLDEN